MRISKKQFGFALAFVVIVALVYGVFRLNKDIAQVWGDASTWEYSQTLMVDESNLNLDVEEDGSKKMISVPYCLLSKITKLDSGNIQFDCSYVPYYFHNISKSGFKDFKELKSDVVFTYVPTSDPLPKAYLEQVISKSADIASFGEQELPISFDIVLQEDKLSDTVVNRIKHYITSRMQNKKTLIARKVVEWQMDLYTEKLADSDLKSWANGVYAELYERFRVEETTKLKDFAYTNELRDQYGYQLFFCKAGEPVCSRSFDENPASNILLHMYSLNVKNDPSVTKFLEIVREKVTPFASNKNPNFKAYVPDCVAESKCYVDYQDMQSYTFPVAPIREMFAGTYSGKNVELFKEYMMQYATKNGKVTLSKVDVEKKLSELAAKKYTLGTEVAALTADDVTNLDIMAYYMLHYDMKDSATTNLYKKAYIALLSSHYGFMGDDGKPTQITSFDDFDRMVARSVMQVGGENYIADERVAYWQVVNGIDDRAALVANKRYTASVPLTFLLVYLYL
jgi:hypothetical protein